jgi:hypothetical protein
MYLAYDLALNGLACYGEREGRTAEFNSRLDDLDRRIDAEGIEQE